MNVARVARQAADNTQRGIAGEKEKGSNQRLTASVRRHQSDQKLKYKMFKTINSQGRMYRGLGIKRCDFVLK